MVLMQLMPGTAKEMYVSDAWDPSPTIEGGAPYLRILANQYRATLPPPRRVQRRARRQSRRAGGEVPNIPETREYVRKVVALYRGLQGRKLTLGQPAAGTEVEGLDEEFRRPRGPRGTQLDRPPATPTRLVLRRAARALAAP